MTTRSFIEKARLLAGLLLAGQGLLVVLGILDHEAPLVTGVVLVVLGLALVAWGSRSTPPAAPHPAAGASTPGRRRAVAALGLVAAGGVLAYNLATRSSFALPELAAIAYGALLVLAAPRLDSRVAGARVESLVAFSLPLVAAPLALWAVNAALAAQVGATPLGWYIRLGLVAPMGACLALAGLDATMIGDTVRIATPRGALFLTVGVVCAGLYAMVIFMGVFALFAFQERLPPARLAAYLALGLVGLHVANVLRLVLLGFVGWKYGGEALQTVHRHAGWMLFIVWTLAFWALVLRRFERPSRPAGG